MISRLRSLFRRKTEYEKMNEYLSQAVDTIHLEMLMRKWDTGQR